MENDQDKEQKSTKERIGEYCGGVIEILIDGKERIKRGIDQLSEKTEELIYKTRLSEKVEEIYEEGKNFFGEKYKKPAQMVFAFREELTVISVLSVLRSGEGYSFDSPMEQAVLEAIRRGYTGISDNATPEVMSIYFQGMSDDQLVGHVNHISGITHELLIVDSINAAGIQEAELFASTNHPDADIMVTDSEGVTTIFQAKATGSLSSIQEHLRDNPDIPVYATEEVAGTVTDERIISSGVENEELRAAVTEVFGELTDEEFSALITGGGLSLVIALAMALTPLLKKYFDTDDAEEKERVKEEIAKTAKWSTIRTTAFITAFEVSGLGPILTTYLVAKTLYFGTKLYGPDILADKASEVKESVKGAFYKSALAVFSKKSYS